MAELASCLTVNDEEWTKFHETGSTVFRDRSFSSIFIKNYFDDLRILVDGPRSANRVRNEPIIQVLLRKNADPSYYRYVFSQMIQPIIRQKVVL